jgi:PTS system N-acetylglucosamine-specific IIC component
MAVMHLLHVRLGFSFSAGGIDYVLFFKIAQNPLYMLPVGVAMFVLYWSLGVFFIKKFNLSTIGRETKEELDAAENVRQMDSDSVEMKFINALGGAENLVNVDACTTRLRLIVKSSEIINKPVLKALGAKGFVTPAPDAVQVILGPQAEIIASKIRDALKTNVSYDTSAVKSLVANEVKNVAPSTKQTTSKINATDILSALGNAGNIKSVTVAAITRVKIEVRDDRLLDVAKLKNLGVIEVINLNSSVKQLYIGDGAAALAAQINQLLN